MINKLANKIVRHYISKNKIEKEHEEVYVYSFELLISTILNLLIILIISIATKLIIEGIIFSLCFMVIRSLAGGYHSNTHWGCLLTLLIIFSIYVMLYKLIDLEVIFYMSIVMIVVSAAIPVVAPVDSINKPLTIKEYKRNKKKSIIAYIVFVLIWAVIICFEKTIRYAFAISYPLFVITLMLIIGLIKNRLQINKKININKGDQL